MKKTNKKRNDMKNKIDTTIKHDYKEAIKFLKDNSIVKFKETLDVAINLSIDASKTDQNIRGVVNLPHGTGKKIRVAVMAKGEKEKEAKDAGADIVGSNELNENILKGKLDFDVLIATPDMMPTIGKAGKILGPKGLMPNPKLGTVTQDISVAVINAKSGQVQYRNDKSGIVHAGIGKLNFKDEDLFENLKAFYDAVIKSKPDSAKKTKGSFIKKITLASTMGLGLEINLGSLN